MSSQGYRQLLAWESSNGSALTNSTSITSIIPVMAKGTIPAGILQIGSKIRVRAAGIISTVVTTPGTMTFSILFGAVVVFATQAISLNIVAQTNVTWVLEIELTVRAVGTGTAANVLGIGTFTSQAIIAASAGAAGAPVVCVPATSPAAGTGFDSSQAQAVDFQATWSVASATNSITCEQLTLELAN